MDNLVRVEPRKVNKAICSIHGDIGVVNPMAMVDIVDEAQTLNFTLDGRSDMFCLRCLRDLLLKQLGVIKLVEEER